jgi:hypothetical protein
MRRTYALLLFVVGTQALFADVISIGAVPVSGAGLGAVQTVLTFTSPASSSTETGCVAAGIGGVTVTGAAACPAGFAGGDEQAINNTYSAADLGLSDFNNLQIIFNPNEPQNAGDESITLDLLAVTLWDPATGLILDAKYTTAPLIIPVADPGVGNAGFGFVLDAGQAADFNLLLAAFPDLRIGAAANASDATGGLETIFIRATNVAAIPEPGSYALTGSALLAIALLRRKLM